MSLKLVLPLFLVFSILSNIEAQTDPLWQRLTDSETKLDSSLGIGVYHKGWDFYYQERMDSLLQYAEQFSAFLDDYSGPDPDSVYAISKFIADYFTAHALCGLGFFEKGFPAYHQALIAAEESMGPIQMLSAAYIGLGAFYTEFGDLQQTIYCYNQSIRIVRHHFEPGDHGYRAIGNMMMNLSTTYLHLGNFDNSIGYFNRAMEVYDSVEGLFDPPNAPREMELVKYCRIYLHFGFTNKANEILNQLIAYQNTMEEGYFKYSLGIGIESCLAEISDLNAEYEQALQHRLTMIALAERMEERKFRHSSVSRITKAYIQVIRTYLNLNNWKKADQHLIEAKQFWLRSRSEQHPVWQDLLLLEGEINCAKGEYQNSLNTYEGILAIYDAEIQGFVNNHQISTILINTYILNALSGVIKTHLEILSKSPPNTGELRDEILALCITGQDLLQQLCFKYSKEYSASKILEEQKLFYEIPLQLLYEYYIQEPHQSTLAKIFEIMEKERSMQLLANYRENDAAIQVGIPNDLLSLELISRQRRDQYSALLDGLHLKEEINHELNSEYQRLMKFYSNRCDSISEVYANDYPRYYQLKYDTETISLEAIQSELSDGDLLLEYYQASDRIYILAISKRNTDLFAIENISVLESEISTFVQACNSSPNNPSSPGPLVFQEQGFQIYSKLIAPCLTASGKTARLILIPDGKLSYLPWAALPTDNTPVESFRNIPYLIRDYSILQEYSATLWGLDKTHSPPDYSYLGFAPSYGSSTLAYLRGPDSLRLQQLFAEEFRDGYSPLNYNIPEVEGAVEYFTNGLTFTSNLATESNFKSIVSEGAILHLAMHARTNDQDPMYSHLAFSADDTTEDGTLFAYEIYNLPIQADLAILSACDTGDGKYFNGQGVMSLSRAFKYAGCRNVLMTHWQAHDLTTHEIIGSFFNQYFQNGQMDRSLQSALITHLNETENEEFTHPYYWAGFALIGNGELSSGSNSESSFLWWLFGGVGLIIFVQFIRRRRSI